MISKSVRVSQSVTISLLERLVTLKLSWSWMSALSSIWVAKQNWLNLNMFSKLLKRCVVAIQINTTQLSMTSPDLWWIKKMKLWQNLLLNDTALVQIPCFKCVEIQQNTSSTKLSKTEPCCFQVSYFWLCQSDWGAGWLTCPACSGCTFSAQPCTGADTAIS